MASPPFSIAETTPQSTDIVNAFPAAEQTYRDVVESWLTVLSDPTTGKLKATGITASVLPTPQGRPILSNNATDTVNDIDIAPGMTRDSTDVDTMVLATTLGKRLDVNWAVGGTPGAPAGFLDTGAVGNSTYHIFLIKRPDTGVVDALASLSATAPTMPGSYTLKRRIGSMTRSAGSNVLFTQRDNKFSLRTAASITGFNTANVSDNVTMGVPLGVTFRPVFSHFVTNGVGLSNYSLTLADGSDANAGAVYAHGTSLIANGYEFQLYDGIWMTSTTGTIRRVQNTSFGAISSIAAFLYGWYDDAI